MVFARVSLIKNNIMLTRNINNKLQPKNSTGFTLIEIIIAIAILSFGIILVYGSFASVVNSTYNISARFTAAYLAQEGFEIVRNIRDTNFISIGPGAKPSQRETPLNYGKL